jgi:hypothetical protein
MTEARRHRRRRRWLLVALGVVVAVVAVVAGLAAFVLWPRSPTPITEQDALDDFRASGTGTVVEVVAGPTPGVYAYDADGTEEISMGPLPLPTRDVPDTVTVVVTPAPDGCWVATLNLMEEHTEATTWCLGADGSLVLRGQEKAEKVPGFEVAAETTCAPGTVLAVSGVPSEVRCTLVMDVSGLTLTVDLAGTATVEPGEDVDVGGTTVATRHLVLALDASGDLSGHWNEEHWLTSDLVPVRVVRDVVLDGPGSFDEQTTLTLRDLRPRT